MTFKVIQGHCRCCHLICHIRFLLVSHCKYISILHRFRYINTYLPKKLRRYVTLTTPTWGQFVIIGLLRGGGKTPVPPVGKHGASQLYWGASNSLAPALSVCGHLTSEKRNPLCKKLVNRAFLRMNSKFYYWLYTVFESDCIDCLCELRQPCCCV